MKRNQKDQSEHDLQWIAVLLALKKVIASKNPSENKSLEKWFTYEKGKSDKWAGL